MFAVVYNDEKEKGREIGKRASQSRCVNDDDQRVGAGSQI